MGNLSEVSAQSADTVDERSADQIVAAKEAVLELPHAPFVAAVLDGSIATTAVAAGLGDVAEEVRDAALSLARAAVSGDAAAGKSSEILSAPPPPSTPPSPTRRRPLTAPRTTCAAPSSRCTATAPTRLSPRATRDANRRSNVSSRRFASSTITARFLASRSLASLAGDLGLAASALVSQLKSEALTGTTPEARRAAAAGAAGIVKGLGGDCISKYGVVGDIASALASKKDPAARAGGLALYTHMCATAGRQFEPFAINLASTVFCMQGDQSSEVRAAADAARSAVVKALPLTAMKLQRPRWWTPCRTRRGRRSAARSASAATSRSASPRTSCAPSRRCSPRSSSASSTPTRRLPPWRITSCDPSPRA